MKKISIVIISLFAFSLLSATALATSGACSSHYGVNCSAGPSVSGNVVCNDGWVNSSVSYYDTNECSSTSRCVAPIASGCTSQSEVQTLIANQNTAIQNCKGSSWFSGFTGSSCNGSSYDTSIQTCQDQVNSYQQQESSYLSCLQTPSAADNYYSSSSQQAQQNVQAIQSSSAALNAEFQKIITLTQTCQASYGSSSMYAESKNGCVCFEGNSSIATQCVSPSPTTSSQAIQATSSLNLFAGVFSSSGSTTTQFSIGSNLQVGSSGNNVISLQKFLESKGFLTMPSGSSEGYLGGVTKKALIAFQASVGLPATGYCGSMTRSAISASK